MEEVNPMESWPCTIEGTTHAMSGTRVNMKRRFDGAGDVYATALLQLLKRPDRGAPFVGEAVNVHTPLHNLQVLVERDADGRIELRSEDGKRRLSGDQCPGCGWSLDAAEKTKTCRLGKHCQCGMGR